MGRRTWLKLYADAWLRGTLREETAETRGVWGDLLALAADSAYGDEGMIQLAPGVGLTDVQIEDILQLTKEEWGAAKPRLVVTDRIKVVDGNCIQIVNWKRYQSEYSRQKQYRGKGSETSLKSKKKPNTGKKRKSARKKKKKAKVTPKSDTRKLHRERDIERDIDKTTEKDKDTVGQARPDALVKVVVDYLNAQIGSRFKPDSKKTAAFITARMKEGWELLDFRKVIDLKCAQWDCEPEMRRYRRPETLFGTKFESYVNEAELAGKKKKRNMGDIVGREDSAA